MPYRLLSSDGSVRRVSAEWVSAAENITIEPAIDKLGAMASQVDVKNHSIEAGEVFTHDVSEHRATERRIQGQRLACVETAKIEFESVGDGRGFSLAAELRESNRFERPLYACGKLIPDQLTLAFQCGFDGVVLDESSWTLYGELAWLDALKPVVDKGYGQSRWRAIDSIWKQRQIAAR